MDWKVDNSGPDCYILENLSGDREMPKQVWILKDPTKELPPRDGPTAEEPQPTLKGKNPAVAATLSLLIWGTGQFYVRHMKSGFLFLLLMTNFCAIVGLECFYWNFFTAFLDRVHIGRSNASAVVGTICVTGLLIWVFNILHAFYSADNKHAMTYERGGHPLLAAFCSALVPGWGQLLNGQPKKAFIFLIFAGAGLAAGTVLTLTMFVWPRLNTVDDRIAVEWLIVAAAVVSPPVFLMWLMSIFDAAKVGWDPVKREPLRKRFEYAINRIRIKGLARGILPQFKVFLMLMLFLILSAVLFHSYFPIKNYAPILQSLEKTSADRRMVLTPYLIDHLLHAIANENRSHPAGPLSDEHGIPPGPDRVQARPHWT
jgi:TM2 domain-containing membrane protein YozV